MWDDLEEPTFNYPITVAPSYGAVTDGELLSLTTLEELTSLASED
ncbi:MAG: hypothetical protein U5K54_28695 [Cytophagales bacterium]|nr:hypothetical protein [Cytophagales bacterium]